ncbi:MAG: flagellar basal body rod protein FlgB [Clostridium sp.]|jgi:flagellar basal-body rod protein FlgB|nr:flagellar basal body rod protein FlgB [Clostridium sp.]
MFQSGAFSYIDVLDKAADANMKRFEALSNNVANATTPNYKRQDVSFEDELKRALAAEGGAASLDKRVRNIDLNRLEGEPYVDNAGYSYRLDDNNVDPDAEFVMIAENQVKYTGLMQSLTQEFQNLQSVMK